MQQVVITKVGGPEVLQVREAPDPSPMRGEIRIAVAAAGLNFADVSARVGLYPDAPKPPMTVGYEVSGTVDAVGGGVDGFAVGDDEAVACDVRGAGLDFEFAELLGDETEIGHVRMKAHGLRCAEGVRRYRGHAAYAVWIALGPLRGAGFDGGALHRITLSCARLDASCDRHISTRSCAAISPVPL